MESEILIQTVKSLQNGDETAFEALYNEFAQSVYFLTLKLMKNKQEAEEITQDVFMTVHKKISELKDPQAFPAWLNRIAVNKCTRALNKNNALTAETEEKAGIEFIEETDALLIPDKALDNAETARLIIEIVDRLPLPQRVCVYYFYYERLSVADIAEQLAVSENTVKTRLALAREKIRRELEQLEDKEGLKLYMGTPFLLIPLLRAAMEHTEVPAQIFARITNAFSITASAATEISTTAAAETTTVTAAAETTTAAASAVSVKVIAAAIAGIVCTAGIITAVVLAGSNDVPAAADVTRRERATGQAGELSAFEIPYSPAQAITLTAEETDFLERLAGALASEDFYAAGEIKSEGIYTQLTEKARTNIITHQVSGLYITIHPKRDVPFGETMSSRGYVYYGEIADGIRSGTGTWFSFDPGNNNYSYYIGLWENDFPNGHGTLVQQAIDKSILPSFRMIYEGTFHDGLYSGTGISEYHSDFDNIVHRYSPVYVIGVPQIAGIHHGTDVMSFCEACGICVLGWTEHILRVSGLDYPDDILTPAISSSSDVGLDYPDDIPYPDGGTDNERAEKAPVGDGGEKNNGITYEGGIAMLTGNDIHGQLSSIFPNWNERNILFYEQNLSDDRRAPELRTRFASYFDDAQAVMLVEEHGGIGSEWGGVWIYISPNPVQRIPLNTAVYINYEWFGLDTALTLVSSPPWEDAEPLREAWVTNVHDIYVFYYESRPHTFLEMGSGDYIASPISGITHLGHQFYSSAWGEGVLIIPEFDANEFSAQMGF